MSQQNLLKEKAELAATAEVNLKEAHPGLDAPKRIDVDMTIPADGEAATGRPIMPASSKSPQLALKNSDSRTKQSGLGSPALSRQSRPAPRYLSLQ